MNEYHEPTASVIENPSAFLNLIKNGIYQSLCEQDIISNHCLMLLLQMQRSEKPCQ